MVISIIVQLIFTHELIVYRKSLKLSELQKISIFTGKLVLNS